MPAKNKITHKHAIVFSFTSARCKTYKNAAKVMDQQHLIMK